MPAMPMPLFGVAAIEPGDEEAVEEAVDRGHPEAAVAGVRPVAFVARVGVAAVAVARVARRRRRSRSPAARGPRGRDGRRCRCRPPRSRARTFPAAASHAAGALTPRRGSVSDHWIGNSGSFGVNCAYHRGAPDPRTCTAASCCSADASSASAVGRPRDRERDEPHVADLALGRDRHADERGEARRERRPVLGDAVGEAHHQLAAGRRVARVLEPRLRARAHLAAAAPPTAPRDPRAAPWPCAPRSRRRRCTASRARARRCASCRYSVSVVPAMRSSFACIASGSVPRVAA